MTRTGRVRAAGAAVLALALAGGCSVLGGPPAPRTPAPVQASWPGCEAVGAFVDDRGQGPVGVGGVPAGFVANRVVLCSTEVGTGADGAPGVELERTSTEVTPLVTYLAQPDERPTDGACTADGWTAPWLFLLDADGRYVAPRLPVDGCGKPLGWYRERGTAWGVLAYSDRVLGPSKDLAEQVGCPAAQADVVGALSSSSHRRAGAFVGDPFAGRPLRFCVYDASGAGGEPGPFVTGQSLVPDERAAFLAALASAPESTGPCSSEDGQVAVVGPRDGSANVFVELGGCRRVVSETGSTPVVHAGDDLVGLLGG